MYNSLLQLLDILVYRLATNPEFPSQFIISSVGMLTYPLHYSSLSFCQFQHFGECILGRIGCKRLFHFSLNSSFSATVLKERKHLAYFQTLNNILNSYLSTFNFKRPVFCHFLKEKINFALYRLYFKPPANSTTFISLVYFFNQFTVISLIISTPRIPRNYHSLQEEYCNILSSPYLSPLSAAHFYTIKTHSMTRSLTLHLSQW